MKKSNLFGLIMLCNTCTAFAHSSHHSSTWQKINVDPQIEIIDDDGMTKTINPSCALDTLTNPAGGEPLDNAFHFYYKQGKSNDLLVYFNGGGACWTDSTCVASLALSSVPDARPAYNPSILTENAPDNAGGIFDDSKKENPFKNWSKVFIPYCTGDIHIGSSDTTYYDVDGSITGFPGAPVQIKHRGFDNFMAVREWLKNNRHSKKHRRIDKLMVTGSSAGGYGATLNFPYLKTAFPKAKTYLLADASAAIVTQGFIDDVFNFDKNWQVESTLPILFKELLTTYSALGFNHEVFSVLTAAYPSSRFAQYTTSQDAVQVQFLKIMDQVDQGNNNPFSWGLSTADFMYFYEWNLRMESSLDYLSDSNTNYQYYIGAGSVHSILTDAFATDAIPHPFYSEQSADGVKFSRWLKRFISSRRFHQQSVKYSD